MQETDKSAQIDSKMFQLRSMDWLLGSQRRQGEGFCPLSGGLDFYFPHRALVVVGFVATR